MKQPLKKLNLWMLIALVSGNMIGSGVFLLPSGLASLGSLSLYSWILTTVGALFLALIFAKMSRLVPRAGGPYAYADVGFGEYIGFQTAYCYWVALWVGNAAIAVAMVGYLAVFFPILSHPIYTCLASIAAVWILTVVNISGVHRAGLLQLGTTILKFLPLIFIAVAGWHFVHWSNITHYPNLTHHSNFLVISNGAALTLWAFIGLESATVPADDVENPARNIPLATVIGTILAAIVYIASSVVIIGMIPAPILQHSTSPFADAAQIIMGSWGRWIIACGAMISCLGALNGWILLQGQIAMAAADKKIFPQVFAKRNKHQCPALGQLITSSLITLLLLLTSNESLVHQFDLIILLATLASLFPYFVTAMAQIIVLKKNKHRPERFYLSIIIAIVGGLYSAWAILGTGERIIFYGALLLLSSIPLYTWVKWFNYSE